MTWIEKIEAAKLRRNDTAGECMAMIQALAAERDELQAQVAVLRGALLNNRIKFCEKFDNRKNHSTICYPPWGNICEELENCEEIERILSTTTSEAAESVQKLVAALEEIQARCELRISDDDAHFENYYEAQNAISEWRNSQ